jgi:hypothetical protein
VEQISSQNPVEDGYLEPNPTEEEIQEQIEVIEMVNDAMNTADLTLNYT